LKNDFQPQPKGKSIMATNPWATLSRKPKASGKKKAGSKKGSKSRNAWTAYVGKR
jgi:hypothetical protein